MTANIKPEDNIPNKWNDQEEKDLAFRSADWDKGGKEFYETRKMLYTERKAKQRWLITTMMSIVSAVIAVIGVISFNLFDWLWVEDLLMLVLGFLS